MAYTREIRLITAATKNSQIPQINTAQCDFLMCSDVLTDTVHLRVIWGNALQPVGGGREGGGAARLSGQKVLVLKTALIILAHVRLDFAAVLFNYNSQQRRTMAALTPLISSSQSPAQAVPTERDYV